MIADLERYAEYKESGLPWLGQVPGHWASRRMKFLFKERTQKGFPQEPLLAATQSKGVVRKEDYGIRTVTAVNGLENLKLVEVGDFVISLRSFQGGIEFSHARGIISPAYTVLQPRDDFEPRYFKLYFKSADFISGLTLFVTGIREGQNVDYERLSRAFMPLPPPEEQAAIVRFLDWANGRLERTIRAKRKVIALLNEQKQAIIHRAVTRGLDPTVTLRPSGIPWLGDIPGHWKVLRNLSLFSNRVEPGQEGLPVLQVSLRSGVTAMEFDQFGRPKRLIANPTKYKLLRKGDLAYNTMRMWQGAVGVAPTDGLVSPAYVVLVPRAHTLPEFYDLVFHTSVYKQEANRHSTGIVSDRNRLYWESFKQMTNIGLPVSEQAAIVAFVHKETRGIDTAAARLEREIDLLREYRTRLVADVVTGKLDVREAAVHLHEAPPPDEAEYELTLADEPDFFSEEVSE